MQPQPTVLHFESERASRATYNDNRTLGAKIAVADLWRSWIERKDRVVDHISIDVAARNDRHDHRPRRIVRRTLHRRRRRIPLVEVADNRHAASVSILEYKLLEDRNRFR